MPVTFKLIKYKAWKLANHTLCGISSSQHRLVCECGAEKLVLSLLKNFTFSAMFLSALDGVDTMRKYLIRFDDKNYIMAAVCSSENEVQRCQWKVK
jgi:hypothetical protein